MKSTADHLKELADTIPAGAGVPAECRVALADLRKELRSGGARIAGMNLVGVYPPESLLPDRVTRLHRACDALATVRDVLVFLPIMLTWGFLGGAVASWYGSGTDLSFLAYWQSGPSGVTSIGEAAHLVLAVLIAVGTLIVLVALLDQIADRRGSRAEQRRRLSATLARATLLLAVPMTPSQVSSTDLNRVTGQIHESVAQLKESMAPMSDTLARLPGTLDDLLRQSPVDAVREAIGSMEKALGEWTRSAQDLSGLSETLKAPTDTLNEFVKLHTSMAKDQERLRASLDTLIGRLERSTEHSAQEAHALGQVAGAARETLEQFGRSLDMFTRHGDSVGVLVYQLQELLKQLDDEARDGPDRPLRDNVPGVDGRGRR